jgi:hypothetical protein
LPNEVGYRLNESRCGDIEIPFSAFGANLGWDFFHHHSSNFNIHVFLHDPSLTNAAFFHLALLLVLKSSPHSSIVGIYTVITKRISSWEGTHDMDRRTPDPS